jgi:hypothetical protein
MRVDEFRRRRFRCKGEPLLDLHFYSMVDPSEHFLEVEVLRNFPPRNDVLQLCRIKKTWHLRCHIPGSLSWEPEASTLGARARQ